MILDSGWLKVALKEFYYNSTNLSRSQCFKERCMGEGKFYEMQIMYGSEAFFLRSHDLEDFFELLGNECISCDWSVVAYRKPLNNHSSQYTYCTVVSQMISQNWRQPCSKVSRVCGEYHQYSQGITFLRQRFLKHISEMENIFCFSCFLVIETRVEIWENEKWCGSTRR